MRSSAISTAWMRRSPGRKSGSGRTQKVTSARTSRARRCGAAPLKRLAALAKRARIAACADDAGNVAALDEAARAAGVKIDVLVEVNVGANRCGVEPGAPAVKIAQAIAGAKNLRFAGLQAYQGAAQ